MVMKFELDTEQIKKLEEWSLLLPNGNKGAIGGWLEFSFTPNSIGTTVKVKDLILGLVLDLTDYDSWWKIIL